jgi:hypothetical protein
VLRPPFDTSITPVHGMIRISLDLHDCPIFDFDQDATLAMASLACGSNDFFHFSIPPFFL